MLEPAGGPELARHSPRSVPPAAAAVLAVLVAACGGDGPAEPATPSTVVVTSPIGAVMATDRSVQLDAEAQDAGGQVLTGQSFTWSAGDPAVAVVSGSGTVQGVAAGTTAITASTDGVSGSLEMRVVAADLAAVGALLDDAFAARLLDGLTTDVRTRAESTWAECGTALDAGHILALSDCFTAVRDESATEGGDRARLAVLAILALRAEQHLGLDAP